MSKGQNRARRAATLPAAPERYDHGREQEFRLVLEQEIQQLQIQIAAFSGIADVLGLVVDGETVTFGANDTGDAGFRVLQVPNV